MARSPAQTRSQCWMGLLRSDVSIRLPNGCMISVPLPQPQGEQGKRRSVLQLKPRIKCAADRETREKHILDALTRDLPEFEDLEFLHEEIILCGSGPSLTGEIETIRDMDVPILAINKAHDFLIEHGIFPEYAFTGHPTADMIESFRLKSPEVTYIIASQCHPNLFAWLEGLDVVLSHWVAGDNELNLLNGGKLLVGGGNTSGVRALVHCYYKGTRTFHMFGFDSSYADGQRNVNREEQGGITVEIENSHKPFETELAFALQVDQIQDVLTAFPDIIVHSYGDGLFQELMRERQNAGMGQCISH